MEPYYFLKRNPIMEIGTFDISVVALDILGLILGENICENETVIAKFIAELN
jgi:hypothetical protein